MAYELVEEVLDHAPAELGATETLVLVAIAEKARKGTRSADVASAELARRARVSTDGLKKALQRLRKKGIDLRVAIGIDLLDRPIYAVPGRVSSYQIPVFEPPEGCSCHRCSLGGKISLLRTKEGTTSRQGGQASRQGGNSVPAGGTGVPPIQTGDPEGVSPVRSDDRPRAAVVGVDLETTDRQSAINMIREATTRAASRRR